ESYEETEGPVTRGVKWYVEVCCNCSISGGLINSKLQIPNIRQSQISKFQCPKRISYLAKTCFGFGYLNLFGV
ncbi:MAG: hypothetical protein QMD22_10490, partial [archaeon]|nr:hypothetical protein [archaeon]